MQKQQSVIGARELIKWVPIVYLPSCNGLYVWTHSQAEFSLLYRKAYNYRYYAFVSLYNFTNHIISETPADYALTLVHMHSACLIHLLFSACLNFYLIK